MNGNPVESYKTPKKDAVSSTWCDTCVCEIFSPILLEMSPASSVDVPLELDVLDISANAGYLIANECVQKLQWVCDYADDIFHSLLEVELNRYVVEFRSEQFGFRHSLLHILKMASEKYKLARTTLHLAMYLLDYFMDNFTIRQDNLNLTALTCLMVAGKIEETDVDMPRFAQLNELIGGSYELVDFKSLECKLLTTLNFDLLRPTSATFAEYFANFCLTLDDYHLYMQNWHTGVFDFQTLQLPPLYTSYEEMLLSLNKRMFYLIDMTLNYYKFANVRPSILAASCLAAGRQLHNIFPMWTPYLEALTGYKEHTIRPYVEALVTLHKLNNAVINCGGHTATASTVLCDSPDSGIASSDMKCSQSSAEESADNDEGGRCFCADYPLAKKRRLC